MPKGTRNPDLRTPAGLNDEPEEDVGSLADLVTTFGEKLDTIEGEKVVVHRVDFTSSIVDDLTEEADEIAAAGGARPQVTKDVVIIHCRPFGHPDVSPERFYSFSAPLIKALREAEAKDAWPQAATFVKRKFDGGRKEVWAIK